MIIFTCVSDILHSKIPFKFPYRFVLISLSPISYALPISIIFAKKDLVNIYSFSAEPHDDLTPHILPPDS